MDPLHCIENVEGVECGAAAQGRGSVGKGLSEGHLSLEQRNPFTLNLTLRLAAMAALNARQGGNFPDFRTQTDWAAANRAGMP
ncbi:hypothetical protein JTE90_026515 [Oedothorax gibbosus]|uniref:Uncharacterized protein n=1 Tax=Oedothorax gibbosus TaxID=931172 RepID=A0AAV6VS87_9ARAC|nr:hypothetical protein JTE90_026515 [Oedothorax gibbosus]